MGWVDSIPTYKWQTIKFDDLKWWWVEGSRVESTLKDARREVLFWLASPQDFKYRVFCEGTWEVLVICLSDIDFESIPWGTVQ